MTDPIYDPIYGISRVSAAMPLLMPMRSGSFHRKMLPSRHILTMLDISRVEAKH